MSVREAEPEPWWTEFRNGGKGLTNSVTRLEKPAWQTINAPTETPEEAAARREKQAQEAAEYLLHSAAVNLKTCWGLLELES